MNPRTSWFALQTRPKSERSVAATLKTKGYEAFYPLYREKRRWSDRYVQLERPLFPGYVFCRVASEAFGKILLTPGVTRLLGFGPTPVEIPAAEIEALQRLNASDLSRTPWKYVPIGTRIRIESGPLQGVEGIYLRDSNGRRLILSVDLFQRSVAVALATEIAIRVITSG